MKLKSFLASKSLVQFDFVRVEHRKAESDKSLLAILHLKSPIASVTGSQSVGQGADAERLVAYDVMEVWIAESDMDSEGIEVNEDGSGTVNTNDLQLDVAKGTFAVWLKSQSFASWNAGNGRARAAQRDTEIYNKVKDLKAARSLSTPADTTAPVTAKSGKVKPESVPATA